MRDPRPDPFPFLHIRLGRLWSEDKFFTGGYVYASNAAVANTIDDPLYNSERYGETLYQIPVPPGTYTVIFHFAEI
jgi:Malectin domain